MSATRYLIGFAAAAALVFAIGAAQTPAYASQQSGMKQCPHKGVAIKAVTLTGRPDKAHPLMLAREDEDILPVCCGPLCSEGQGYHCCDPCP